MGWRPLGTDLFVPVEPIEFFLMCCNCRLNSSASAAPNTRPFRFEAGVLKLNVLLILRNLGAPRRAESFRGVESAFFSRVVASVSRALALFSDSVRGALKATPWKEVVDTFDDKPCCPAFREATRPSRLSSIAAATWATEFVGTSSEFCFTSVVVTRISRILRLTM